MRCAHVAPTFPAPTTVIFRLLIYFLSLEGLVMADFLTQTRTDLDNRLKELRPLYEEYLKLEKAKAALEGVDTPRRRGPGRPPGSATRAPSGNGRRRRRRRRGGTRAEQALSVV